MRSVSMPEGDPLLDLQEFRKKGRETGFRISTYVTKRRKLGAVRIFSQKMSENDQ
jgi:hypothetical protein